MDFRDVRFESYKESYTRRQRCNWVVQKQLQSLDKHGENTVCLGKLRRQLRRPEKKIQGLRKRGRGVRDELSGISIGHSTSSLQRKWTKSGPCVFISVSSIKYDPFSFNKAKSTCYDYSWAGIYVVRYVDSKLEV